MIHLDTNFLIHSGRLVGPCWLSEVVCRRTALGLSVPMAKTMIEKVSAQRAWAAGRARNASTAQPVKIEQETRRMEF